MGIFDALTLLEWFAILRIGVGLWWLESVRHKDIPGFWAGKGMGWVETLVGDNHPIPPYARFIRRFVLSTPSRRVWNSRLVLAGEFCVGISLVFGLLTPAGLAVGLFLNLNYLMLAGMGGDYGEQGQNLMMILSESVLLGAGAWRVWSLDNLLF